MRKLRETLSSSSEGRGPLQYLEVPFRRPLHFLVPLVVVVVVALAASQLATRRYKAAAVLLIETEDVPAAFAAKATYNWEAKRLSNVRQDVKSRTRLEVVLKQLDPYPELRRRKLAMSSIVEEMREAIAVEFVANDTFTIEFTHKDPRTAANVANRLAALLIEGVEEHQSKQVAGAAQFVDTQLDEARRGLEEKEQALRAYKQSHPHALPEQVPGNMLALQRLEQETQSLDGSLRLARERLSQAEKSLADPVARVASAAPGLEPGGDLPQLRAQLLALRGRYTAEHPDVVMLQARIDRLEKQLTESGTENVPADPAVLVLHARLDPVRAEIVELERRRAAVQKQIVEVQLHLDSIPVAEQEMASLSRDLTQLRENYAALLAKKLEVGMAERLKERWTGDHFRVVDPAHVPDFPSYPNRLIFLLVGVVGGLLAGAAACVAVELFDHSIASIGELEAAVPYPVLAAIPHVRPALRGPRSWLQRLHGV